MLYINNNKTAGQSDTISSADITASQSLAETYIAILNSRAVLSETLTQADSEYTEGELQDMLSASVVNSTELIEVSVTSPDPEEAARLTNAMVDVSSAKMMETVNACNVQIVDYAEVPENPSSPECYEKHGHRISAGTFSERRGCGAAGSDQYVIRSEKDLNTLFEEIPVLGVIPELSTKSSGGYGGYGYGYGRAGTAERQGGKQKESRMRRRNFDKKKEKNGAVSEENFLLNDQTSFAVREAYKSLRTNVMFSLTAGESGRIIGVTSTEKRRGKEYQFLQSRAFHGGDPARRSCIWTATCVFPWLRKGRISRLHRGCRIFS